MTTEQFLQKRALRLSQSEEHPLYLFSLTADELGQIAEVSRVSRDNTGKLIGYQRPEVKRHVQDIVDYLDSNEVVFPNSIILALSSKVQFRRSRGPQTEDGFAAAGTLEIPIANGEGVKVAWIVDGQQRALALSKAKRRDIAVPVNAFVADDVALQRDQFLRVNNTRPLPRGLITELLPEISSPLPGNLAARKLPAALCEQLNRSDVSPFKGLIRRASSAPAAKGAAVVADASVVKMLHESLNTPGGCLFPYRNMATGETDIDGIWQILITYWTAVARTFPEAWGKSPSKSRLMHGAGIRGMGRLMDRVMSSLDPRHKGAEKIVMQELARLAPRCSWTHGRWDDLGGMRWDEIQNVPKHIRLLSNFLVRCYVEQRSAA